MINFGSLGKSSLLSRLNRKVESESVVPIVDENGMAISGESVLLTESQQRELNQWTENVNLDKKLANSYGMKKGTTVEGLETKVGGMLR